MFCLHCGNKLPDNAIFCNRCGRRQSPIADPPTRSSIIAPGPSSPNIAMDTGQPSSGNTPLVQAPPSQFNSKPAPQAQETPSLLNSAPIGQSFSNQAAQLTPSLQAYVSKRSAGSIIAAIAGLVALLAFFFMPYVSIPLGIFGTLSLTGQQLASYGDQAANSPYGNQLAALQLLWLAPLIAVIIIAIAAYIIFKSAQANFDEMSAKRAALGLISVAAITLVVLFIRYAIDAQPPSGSSYGYSGPTLASFYSSGFWVYVLSMIAAIVGGVVQARSS